MKNLFRKEVLLTLLFPVITYSQVKLGIKGSVHRSNISEIHKESEGRISGSFGAFCQIPLDNNNQFFFQPEVIYSLEGEKGKHKSNDIKFFQNYLNIPLMFRAYFSEAESEFFGEIGPQIGFLVSQKNKDLDILYYNDKPKTLNLSIGFGIGYSILRNFEFSIRYNYGLIDVYKDYPKQERTSVLGASLAYIFN